MEFRNLTKNRYAAIEEVRTLLRFGKSEWKFLLKALAKTDNGWLQFYFGDLTVDFKKFVDQDELHMRIEFKKGDNGAKFSRYVYDLYEFTKPPSKCSPLNASKE